MLGVRLDKETEERLDKFCKATGHTKSYIAKEALARFLGEWEDYLLCVARLHEGSPRSLWDAVRIELGLDKPQY